MLRVALFGVRSAVSVRSLEAVARRHRVAAVIESGARPAGALGALRAVMRRWRRGPSQLALLAGALGAAHWMARGRRDPTLAGRLRRLAPDLICIAGYPWILPPDVFTTARLGAINLHTSLLPRHRGVMPLYWLYHDNDRTAGVTVHWVAERADAGDILSQEEFPLARGCPIDRVHARCADLGAQHLVEALDAIERGTAACVAQDERLATPAPMVRPGTRMADFAAWDVERVWHYLAGLLPVFREPLAERSGRPVPYTGVPAFDEAPHAEDPGAVRATSTGYDLFCRGGIVHLVAPPP